MSCSSSSAPDAKDFFVTTTWPAESLSPCVAEVLNSICQDAGIFLLLKDGAIGRLGVYQ